MPLITPTSSRPIQPLSGPVNTVTPMTHARIVCTRLMHDGTSAANLQALRVLLSTPAGGEAFVAYAYACPSAMRVRLLSGVGQIAEELPRSFAGALAFTLVRRSVVTVGEPQSEATIHALASRAVGGPFHSPTYSAAAREQLIRGGIFYDPNQRVCSFVARPGGDPGMR